MFVTCCLAGVFVGAQRRIENGRDFVEVDRMLDHLSGPKWLESASVAQCVVNHILEGHGKNYDLRSFVVMPNHVHLLLEPYENLSAITRKIKGRSARDANLLLQRTGQRFWQDESFDHWIRDLDQFERVQRYIERNPVFAGFVLEPRQWPWSSASIPIVKTITG